MRTIFAVAFFILVAAGLATYVTEPESLNEVPVMFWVIDPAPARQEQMDTFHRWLIKHGHCRTHTLKTMADVEDFLAKKWSPAIKDAVVKMDPRAGRLFGLSLTAKDLPLSIKVPIIEVRLDAANNALEKKLVQGLSGVSAAVIDTYNGGQQMQYLAASGMLADLTESAVELGFDPGHTYQSLAPALFYDGRQLSFPRNVANDLYWVNKKTFRKYGQPLPPKAWTIEEFEKRGKAFVKAANPPGGRQTVFFADSLSPTYLTRGMGLSVFNETLTTCILDDPRYAKALDLIRKWTYDDRIIPSDSDRASFDVAGGWGGSNFQLFNNGNFGMFMCGRWALMLFRKFGSLELTVVEPPSAGFRNVMFSGAQATVYKASPHRREAELFLAYLASEDYGMQIVRDGDAMPPNPVYARTEEFRHPPKYPNEWDCHELFLETADTIAIPEVFSPFVLPMTAERLETDARGAFLAGLVTSARAGAQAAEAINKEIAMTLRENDRLRSRHEALLEQQADIDALKKSGQKIPRELVLNPFYQRYYAHKGMLK